MRTRLVLVALLVTSALAACGKGEAPPASSGDPTTTTTEEAAEESATTVVEESGEEGDDDAAAGEATELSFSATEYAYAAESNEPIPAGDVAITLTNDGEEEHQLSIARLREGKTIDDLAAVGSDPTQLPAVLETFGGPNAVAPGESVTATQALPAGDFLFLCFIPAPDGEPHAVKGMLLPVTVEGEGGDESAFEGEGDPLPLSDYTFGLGTAEEPAEIDATDDLWITNDGPQPHEAAIYTLAEGATNEDVVEYFANPTPSGPPPMVPAGGIGPIDPGRFARVPLEAGDYVFICFIPDATDGAPHFVHGMLQFATVT